ncbi:MAG: hypothetical protein JWR15_4690 [Prosthecobacter sp.]|nr:hypothetical protein [Prosthecobacter sp.]
MFRTAIPFGYLFIMIFLGGVFIVGMTCFIWGRRTRRRPLQVMGAILSLGVVGLITADATLNSLMEWNPLVRDDKKVVGIWLRERSMWMDFSESITLHADHHFEYHSDAEGFSGRWERNDWNLHLTAEGIDWMMRFIEYSGELRLLSRPPDDPDLWNGNLGLERVQPSASELK